MTKIRCSFLAFAVVAVVLIAVLSRSPAVTPSPSLPVRSPGIPQSKVKPQMAVTYGSAVLLAPNGTLWTSGERMGAPKKTISMKRLRDAVNSVTKFIGLGPVFDTWEQTPCDEAPARIWSLPVTSPDGR